MSAEDVHFDHQLDNRLRVVRQMLKLSEEEAAAAAGVTTKTYRKWEAGGHMQTGATLMRFCKSLGVPIDWMLEESVTLNQLAQAMRQGAPLQ